MNTGFIAKKKKELQNERQTDVITGLVVQKRLLSQIIYLWAATCVAGHTYDTEADLICFNYLCQTDETKSQTRRFQEVINNK